MSSYLRDIQDQIEERAFDVREPEYWGEPGDYDRTPDRDELVDPNRKPAWWEQDGHHSEVKPVKYQVWSRPNA